MKPVVQSQPYQEGSLAQNRQGEHQPNGSKRPDESHDSLSMYNHQKLT